MFWGGQEENKQTFTKISRVAEQTVKNVNKQMNQKYLASL